LYYYINKRSGLLNEIKIEDMDGIFIGHAEDLKAATGCTVILCENGARAGIDVRGGAPASKETELLKPFNLIDTVHAILLTGGSSFALDAAAGVMEYLENKNVGFDTGVARVPIVPAAALFDLAVGHPGVRPDKKMGYDACVKAKANNIAEGNAGAGTGASVGKLLGMKRAMKSGIGIYGLQTGALKVISIVAVNALGDVFDPDTLEAVAGLLDESGRKIISTEEEIYSKYRNKENGFSGNTTIGCVITNARFSKTELTKIASMTHDGFARAIKPIHTMYDGDTVFALSTGEVEADITAAGTLAARTTARAIYRGAITAESAYGLKAMRDL
jgi:L-aminopeptidase/D-esterase-like protein